MSTNGAREMKDAVESAQVREEDRVKKVRQYLSGDAKIKVGEFHETMQSALAALERYYGNPRAIWGKCKRDLENAVGNFNRD